MILRLYCAVSALLLGSLGVCQGSSSTTTTIETTISSGPPNITSCYNGGFNYFDAEEEIGKCNCPSYWIGDDCETIVCTNGGYVVDGTNRCRCPIGYFGVHCEATTTIKPPKGTFSSNKLSQFNIIDLNLYTDYWGMGSYKKYKEALINFINISNQAGNTFSEYNYRYNDFVPYLNLTTLGGPTEINYPENYTFNQDNNQISKLNADDFLDALKDRNNMPRLTRLYYCHKSAIYEAIYDMMKGNNLEQTTITVVTSQPPFPDELGKIAKDKILQMTVAFGITINVIWIEDDIFIRCKPEETQDLKELVQATGGNFLSVRYSPDDTSTADAISSIFDTMYQPQLIANGGASDCSKGHSVTVVPDRSQMPYYVFAKGENVQVSDDCIGVNTKATSYPGDMIILYTQLSPFPCPLTVTSDGACSVLAVGVDQKNLGLQLYPSFVEDSQLDVSRHEPIDGLQLYVALHMEINNASLQNYSISTLASYDDLGNSKNFTFQYRDATFELISDKSFSCNSSANTWWFNVVLNDPITGNAIARRVLPFKCLPPTYSPSPTATEGTTKAATTTVTTMPELMTSTTVGSTSEYSTGSTPLPTSTSTVVTSTTTMMTTTTQTTPTTTQSDCKNIEPGDIQSRTLIFAYPNSINLNAWGRFKTELLYSDNFMNSFGEFGEVNYDVDPNVADCNYNHLHKQNSSTDFGEALYSGYNPNSSISNIENNSPTGLPTILQELISPQPCPSSSNREQLTDLVDDEIPDPTHKNSIALIMINKLTNSMDDYSDYRSYPNKNIKTLIFMDPSDLSTQFAYGERSTTPMNAITAMSNGHFILSNMNNAPDLSNWLNPFLENGPGGTLLFSRNIKPAPHVPIQNAGLADFRGISTVPVFITATTEITKDFQNQGAYRFILILNPVQDSSCNGAPQKIDLLDNSVEGTGYINGSNLYRTFANLNGSCQYYVGINFNWIDPSNIPNIYLRIWTSQSPIDFQFKYKDLQDNDLYPDSTGNGPDNINGAIIRGSLRNAKPDQTIDSITITDCTGQVSKLYESTQTATPDPKDICLDLYFVPFFCLTTTPGCVPGSEGKYDIQFNSPIVPNSNFSEIGVSMQYSFWCSNNASGPVDNCKYQDAAGNYICEGKTAPYYRGPTDVIVDCSGHGQLKYEIDTEYPANASVAYKCICDPGYNSSDSDIPSCDIATCPMMNTSPGTLDMQYRTYTVVVFVDNSNYDPFFVYPHAKAFLDLGDFVADDLKNIWLYQFIALCSDGTAVPIYIGPDIEAFQGSIYNNRANNPNCSSTGTGWDIVYAYKAAIRALGRQQRGIIAIYKEDPDDLLDFNREAFMQVSQQYRQEVYFICAPYDTYNWYTSNRSTIPDKIFEGLMSTGGTVIPTEFNGKDEYVLFPKEFFQRLLQSTVSFFDFQMNWSKSYPFEVEGDAYVIMPGLNSLHTNYDNSIPPHEDDAGSSNFFIKFVKYDAKSHTVFPLYDDKYFVSILVLNSSISPTFAILSDDLKDSSTAISTTQSNTGARLGIYLPNDWKLIDSNYGYSPFSRIADRVNCTFKSTTYIPIGPPTDAGPQFIYLTISNGTVEDSGIQIKKVFPYAVTTNFICQNGGTHNDALGKCDCMLGYYGPDCGLLDCNGAAGKQSGWGDACSCDYSGTDPTCRPINGNSNSFWWWRSNDYWLE